MEPVTIALAAMALLGAGIAFAPKSKVDDAPAQSRPKLKFKPGVFAPEKASTGGKLNFRFQNLRNIEQLAIFSQWNTYTPVRDNYTNGQPIPFGPGNWWLQVHHRIHNLALQVKGETNKQAADALWDEVWAGLAMGMDSYGFAPKLGDKANGDGIALIIGAAVAHELSADSTTNERVRFTKMLQRAHFVLDYPSCAELAKQKRFGKSMLMIKGGAVACSQRAAAGKLELSHIAEELAAYGTVVTAPIWAIRAANIKLSRALMLIASRETAGWPAGPVPSPSVDWESLYKWALQMVTQQYWAAWETSQEMVEERNMTQEEREQQ